jgi:hypothetical protein
LERNGQNIRTEFGALANVMYKIQIMKDFSFTNQLNLFSSYTSHPERVDIAYTGVVNIKFNKFISTIISVDLLYDHDQIQKLQLKQTLGVGISYNLGLQAEDRPDGKNSSSLLVQGKRLDIFIHSKIPDPGFCIV